MFVTYEQFGVLSDMLVDVIQQSGKTYENIIAIPKGGLPLATHLANKLGIKNIILPNQITHELFSENDTALVVDDLVDSGITLFELQEEHGHFDSAVLFFKPTKAKEYNIEPTYYVKTTDKWLVFPWENPNEKPNREGYEEYTCYFDGACKGNPGPGSSGFIIMKDDKVQVEESIDLDHTTNNVAEYNAIIMLLRRVVDLNIKDVTIYGDSKLVINQVLGEWKVKKDHLKPMCQTAQNLLKKIPNYKIKWIPRDKNESVNKLIGGKH